MTPTEIGNEELVAITEIVREADRVFERVGGSSRHWVRDCFWPMLQQHGWTLVSQRSAAAPTLVAGKSDGESAPLQLSQSDIDLLIHKLQCGHWTPPSAAIECVRKALGEFNARGDQRPMSQQE